MYSFKNLINHLFLKNSFRSIKKNQKFDTIYNIKNYTDVNIAHGLT